MNRGIITQQMSVELLNPLVELELTELC
jgi:hypothetical protein